MCAKNGKLHNFVQKASNREYFKEVFSLIGKGLVELTNLEIGYLNLVKDKNLPI
jgi:hypothetical protein